MIHAEIATCEANRIAVTFPYSERLVNRMRTVSGRRWSKPHGHWHVPMDMDTCRQLRTAFGQDLTIGPQLRSWATEAVRAEATLGSLALATTADLKRLPSMLPTLAQAIHLGPLGKYMTDEEKAAALAGPGSYQAADVTMLALAPAPLNGNEQGTGKTPEWIAAIWEAGIEDGCHLVIGPKASVDLTWKKELLKWQADAGKTVEVFACVDNRADREEMLERFRRSTADVKWVVVNPAMVAYVKDETRTSKITFPVTGKKQLSACYCERRGKRSAHEHYVAPYPILHSTKWSSICVDEAHKGSVRNHKTITAKSMRDLQRAEGCKVCVMSGTPMKKKGGSDIWGSLNFLRPDVFTSFWNFVGRFFEIEDNGYGKKVKELIPERTDAFWESLKPYMLRRLKKEVAPWLPDKLYVPIDVFMSPKQTKQYNAMESEGLVEIGDDSVMVGNVISQFTRLKQFANAYCEIKDGDLLPIESPKVDAMLEKMDEAGMFDEGSERKQLVFSQSRRMVEFTAKVLRDKGLKVDIISGKVNKSKERERIMDEFMEGDTRVLCIVTTAGGVSLTLDAADEVHLLDEMWSPDEDAQAEDRAHRVSRIHQVTVFIYRSVGTIDEYVAETKIGKAIDHAFIMDVRRQILSKRAA